MLCAEVGVEIRPVPDSTTKFWVGDPHSHLPDDHPDVIASRKACALAALSDDQMTMCCVTHRKSSTRPRCLRVSPTEVIANPSLRCGAP